MHENRKGVIIIKYIKIMVLILCFAVFCIPAKGNAATTNEAAGDDFMDNDFNIFGSQLYRYTGTDSRVTIPDGVASISTGAFYNNSKLKIVIFTDAVKYIASNAFFGCDNIKNFVAPYNSAAYKFAISKGIPITTSKNIKVPDTSVTMLIGSSLKPVMYNYLGAVTWKSKNKKIVKPVSGGKIKALKQGTTSIYTYINGKRYSIKVKALTRSENSKVNMVIKKVIKKNMTNREKIKAIHNWMIANVKYDYDNYLRGTVPYISHLSKGALLKGKAVCDGYSKAFKKFMDRLSIKCNVVVGTSKGGGHAWNKVLLGGKWYYIDVTFDDPIVNGKNNNKTPYYTYFLVTASQLRKTHSW